MFPQSKLPWFQMCICSIIQKEINHSNSKYFKNIQEAKRLPHSFNEASTPLHIKQKTLQQTQYRQISLVDIGTKTPSQNISKSDTAGYEKVTAHEQMGFG